MEQRISQIVTEICGVEAEDIVADLDLFEAGFLDSFGTLQLLVELSGEFGLALDPGDIAREEIASVEKIVETIWKLKGAA